MKKYGLILSIIVLTISCATKDSGENKVADKKDNRVQKHLVDKFLPKCNSCLYGSAGDEELRASRKEIYFLYGAEHLNLENSYFDIPVVYNAATKKWINYFTKKRGRSSFAIGA